MFETLTRILVDPMKGFAAAWAVHAAPGRPRGSLGWIGRFSLSLTARRDLLDLFQAE